MILKANAYSDINCWRIHLPFSIYNLSKPSILIKGTSSIHISYNFRMGGFSFSTISSNFSQDNDRSSLGEGFLNESSNNWSSNV